jgi:predicted RNase H-like HicB family nuclease
MEARRKYEVVIWRKGGWFVSWCREPDVSSRGQTLEEAVENLKEAIALHLEPPHATGPEED